MKPLAMKEAIKLFHTLRNQVNTLTNHQENKHYTQAVNCLQNSLGALYRDENLPNLLNEFSFYIGSNNLKTITAISNCVSISTLSDFESSSRSYELRSLDLLDRVFGESDGSDKNNLPITNFSIKILVAGQYVGATPIPLLRQITRAAHVMAIEGILLRQPKELKGELTQELKDILDSACLGHQDYISGVYSPTAHREKAFYRQPTSMDNVELSDEEISLSSADRLGFREINSGHDIDPLDGEGDGIGRSRSERPERPGFEIDPPDGGDGGIIGFTPGPDEVTVINDSDFLREAMRRLHLSDIANAIAEARGQFWPCPTVTYAPTQAIPGAEVTILHGSWPDSVARVSFPTADGSQTVVAASRSGNTLTTIVPEQSVSGIVTVYFDSTEEEGSFSPRLPRWYPTPTVHGKRFCMVFFGGLSGFRDLTISEPPGDQRCYAVGDEIELNWISSNLDQLTVTIADNSFSTDEPNTGSMTIIVPSFSEVSTIEITISATGPAPPAPEPYRLSLDIEIDVMPPDRVSPTPPDVLAMRTRISVNNFYSFQSKTQRLPVFRPITLSEIKNFIRSAEADGLTLGVLSTGGSYEDITFSELTSSPTAGTSSALIDLAGMVFDVYVHPSMSTRDSVGFELAYDAFIRNFADNVLLTKDVLLTQLRPQSTLPIRSRSPETGLLSIYTNQNLTEFENSTGVAPSDVRDRLVYIDAGAKIWDVNKALSRLGLVLPTYGASGFQSLAGAISTGTHGSTFKLPPVSDFVRAIHIIGPGGTEWWIEPDGRYGITTSEHLNGQPVLGEDSLRPVGDRLIDRPIIDDRRCCNFVADTALFHDALVAFGQVGVIVGYVFETIDEHFMRSKCKKHPWVRCKERINEFVSTGTTDDVRHYYSREDENILPTDELWFFAPTVSSFGQAWTDYRFLTQDSGDRRLVGSDAFSGFIHDLVDGIHVAHCGLNLLNISGDLVPTINEDFRDGDLGDVDCLHQSLIDTILGSEPDGFVHRPSDVALCGVGFTFENWDELHALKRSRANFGGLSELHDKARAVHAEIIQRGATSHEFCVNAADVVPFVDELLAFADWHRRSSQVEISPPGGALAVVFNANIRFTKNTKSSLGMQRWPMTGHIEIFTHPGLRGSTLLYDELERLATVYRARPHWGQRHETHDYSNLYPRFEQWKRSMSRLARAQGGIRNTFGSGFSRSHLGTT